MRKTVCALLAAGMLARAAEVSFEMSSRRGDYFDAAAPIASSAAILHIRFVEGDGAVYAAGTRSARGLTVLITDETGKPVEAATVSFKLPEDGPGGTFGSGGKSEVITTRADGLATVWGMRWNKTSGAFQIKVTAAKGQARAGAISNQFLSDAITARQSGIGSYPEQRRFLNKWMIIALVAAGVIGGGLAVGALRGSSSSSNAVSPVVPTTIGPPSIVVGGPR